MFGLKEPNLNPNLLKNIYINLKLVISKILSIEFVVATLLLSHINKSESLSKHESYEYKNLIFRAVIHLF